MKNFKFKILDKSTGEIIYVSKQIFIYKLNNNIVKWDNKYNFYTQY
jgi:hypothetical protein